MHSHEVILATYEAAGCPEQLRDSITIALIAGKEEAPGRTTLPLESGDHVFAPGLLTRDRKNVVPWGLASANPTRCWQFCASVHGG